MARSASRRGAAWLADQAAIDGVAEPEPSSISRSSQTLWACKVCGEGCEAWSDARRPANTGTRASRSAGGIAW